MWRAIISKLYESLLIFREFTREDFFLKLLLTSQIYKVHTPQLQSYSSPGEVIRRSQVIQGVSLRCLQSATCKVIIRCFTIAGDEEEVLSSNSRPSRSRWITGTRWSTRTGWTAGTGWCTWTQGGSGTTRASGNQRRAWDPKEMETVFLEPHQFWDW